jgi:hypothetical protein
VKRKKITPTGSYCSSRKRKTGDVAKAAKVSKVGIASLEGLIRTLDQAPLRRYRSQNQVRHETRHL